MKTIISTLLFAFPALLPAQSYQWAFDTGAAQNDVAEDVVVDASGNTYITGYFKNTVDFDPGPGTANRTPVGGQDIFVAGYDAAGNYRWVSTMGGPQDDSGFDLQLDNNGHINITGQFIGSADADPGNGVQLLTATGSGTFVWQLDAATGSYVRAFAIDGFSKGNGIAVDASGNIAITGTFDGSTDFDPGSGTAVLNTTGGNEDVYIAKYDNSFNYSWAVAIGGTGSDMGRAVGFDAGGALYAGGYCTGNIDLDAGNGTVMSGVGGNMEGFLVSYSSTGQFVWGFGLHSTGEDQLFTLHVTGSLVYIGGRHGGTLDFDPSGATANLTCAGNTDIFFAQYSTAGTYNWAKRIGVGFNESCHEITTDASGAVYITGYFFGDILGVDFNAGSGTYMLTSTGGEDIFIARYDAQGNFTWAFNVGSNTGNEAGLGLAVNGSDLWCTGFFTNTADFDPAGATANLTTGTGADVFLAKYGTAFVTVFENENTPEVTLFPNPVAEGSAQAVIALTLPDPQTVNIKLYDLYGKLLQTENYGTLPATVHHRLPVNLQHTAPGIYFLRIETGAAVRVLQLVVTN